MSYTIFCNESRHLEHDNQAAMLLGAILCRSTDENHISNLIKSIKLKYHLSSNSEIKWTKVSKSKLPMYKEIIDLVYEQQLFARILIADKSNLNHGDFGQEHEDWYYKMYYTLISYFSSIADSDYKIYFDMKDTKSHVRVKKLSEILQNKYINSKYITKVVPSEEKQLIQVIDVIIGAAGYKYSGFKTSSAKLELVEYIESKLQVNLSTSTLFRSHKVNVFVWKGRSNNE